MSSIRWKNAFAVAARSLVAARWNAAAAVLVLSVAAAAGHSVTAIWDSTIDRPLSWRNADEIVRVSVEALRESGEETDGSDDSNAASQISDTEVAELAESATSLSWVGAWSPRTAVVGDGAHARLIAAVELPPGAFGAIGAVPSAGRAFDEADHRAVVAGADASTVAILREDLAVALFGTAPGAIGESVEIGRQRAQVVGVMPRDFVFPHPRAVAWLPKALAAGGALTIYQPAQARLAPGATPQTAAAEATEILRRAGLRSEEERIVLSSLTEGLTASIRPTLEVLRAGALLLLLVAAASVASLRLSQALSEQRTSGIRRALGATPGDEIAGAALRIVLLASLVAVGALAVSTWLLPLLRSYGAHLLFAEEWSAGAGAALTAFLAALVAVTLAELPSLFEIVRERSTAMAGGTRGAHGRRPFLMPLLAAGTAASTVILVATAVLAGSAWALLGGRGGYSDADLGVLTVDFGGRGADEAPGRAERRRILDELVERLEALPAVESAGYGDGLPDDRAAPRTSFDSEEGRVSFATRKVSAGLLGTLGVPILAGRGFLDSDRNSGEAVVVVDRAFASLTAENPVGQLVPLGLEQVRVVGVAAEVRAFPARERGPTVYRPYADETGSGPLAAIKAFLAGSVADRTEVAARFRSGLSPERLSALAEIPRTVDPSLRVLKSESVRSRRTGMLGSSALTSVVLVVFAAAGLLLTVVGVIGHISDTMAREAQPNAIRLSLGAEPAVVVWQVARRTGIAAGAGIGLGLLLGWLLARGIGSRIPWVETGDLFLYLGPAALTALLMAAAGLHAGLRASRANPWALLRSL